MTNRAERRARGKHKAQAGSSSPMRILFASNAPFAPTGYGVQTAQLVSRMIADGHEVAIACNYGLSGAQTNWGGVQLYPTGTSPYSDDVLHAHSQHWFAGSNLPTLVMTLFDVWALKNPTIDRIERLAAWTPIDHQPSPPEVSAWLRKPNVMPIAMSKFGSEMMSVDKLEHEYVPHAIEKVFAPTPSIKDADGTSVTGREIMKIDEDRFVVMMNAANKGKTPPRKAFGENLLAFSMFAAKHEDAMLYLHTDQSEALGGINLGALIAACGIKEQQVRFIDQYMFRMNIPQDALAAIYTAADVLLACSAGEGFGVPVIEAQACGTRVIVTAATAQPELVGDGWTINAQPLWDPFQNSWLFSPRIGEIVQALEESYERPRGASQEAVKFAAGYDADLVYAEHWRPVLARLATWRP